MLGAKGSGKSLHARQLAQKQKLFHVQFEEYLQERLMKKTKRLIGPAYEAEEEFKDTPEDFELVVIWLALSGLVAHFLHS